MPCGCATTTETPRQCCCPNAVGRRYPSNTIVQILKFIGLFITFLLRITLILTLVWGKLVLSVYSYGKQCARNRYWRPLLTFFGVFLVCCLVFHELKFALLRDKCPVTTSIDVKVPSSKAPAPIGAGSKESLSKKSDVSKSNVPSTKQTGVIATSATIEATATVKSVKESKDSVSKTNDLSKGTKNKDLIVPHVKSVVNIKFKNPRVKVMEIPYKEKTFSIMIIDETKKTLFEASSKFNVSRIETHPLVITLPSIVLEEYAT